MLIEPLSPRFESQFLDLFVDYFVHDLHAPFEEPMIREKLAVQPVAANAKGFAPVLLAVEGDQVLGFVQFQIDSPDSDWNDRPGWGFIRELYVRRDVRQRGVGAALMQAAETSLKQSGATRLYLTCEENLAFFDALGWKQTQAKAPNGATILEKNE